jgi:ketosteroid isomerase-like protein
MSQANVEAVRRLFDLRAERQDTPVPGSEPSGHPWLSLWHPECVIEEMAAIPDTAVYHGRKGVARYFHQLGEAFDDIRYIPVEIVEGRDGVFVATDMSACSKSGVDVQMRVYQVFRVRDGLIIYATGYLGREQALEAVGLEG